MIIILCTAAAKKSKSAIDKDVVTVYNIICKVNSFTAPDDLRAVNLWKKT